MNATNQPQRHHAIELTDADAYKLLAAAVELARRDLRVKHLCKSYRQSAYELFMTLDEVRQEAR